MGATLLLTIAVLASFITHHKIPINAAKANIMLVPSFIDFISDWMWDNFLALQCNMSEYCVNLALDLGLEEVPHGGMQRHDCQ